MLTTLLMVVLEVLLFLISILFIILGERRILAEIQGREGPSVAGFGGFWQTALDGIKTFFKVVFISRRSFKILFFILPAGLLLINVIKFIVLPVTQYGGAVDFEYDLMSLNILGSVEVFIFVFATWAALSSKFPTLAALREVAQQCAVEALTGFCFVVTALYGGTLSIRTVVDSQEYVWYFFVITPYAYIYYLAVLAELHRTPSDLTEAESELTAGYQAEHGGVLFSLFYLSEYGGIVVSSLLFSLLFLGGWFLPLGIGAGWFVLFLKVVLFGWLVIVTRATLPRVRIRVLASMVWSHLLPLASTALPFYLWVGMVCAVFRVCEYCVFGVLRFKAYIKRLYYLGRSLWYTPPTTHDNRLDTSWGGFLFMRRWLDWGQYGKARTIGNSLVGYMTYPENARLTDSIRLAGGLVAEGARRTYNGFDRSLAPMAAAELGRVKNYRDLASFVQPAKKQAMYWEEALIGSPMKFFEYSSVVPHRDSLALHAATTLPEAVKCQHSTTEGAFDFDDFMFRSADMPGSFESQESAWDEWISRRFTDHPRLPEILAVSDWWGEDEIELYNASGSIAPLLQRRLPHMLEEASYPYGGAWKNNPKLSPSGFVEFEPLWGIKKDDLTKPFTKRFDDWQQEIEDATLESYEHDEPFYSQFYDRFITSIYDVRRASDPSLGGESGALYWTMARDSIDPTPEDGASRRDSSVGFVGLDGHGLWDQEGYYTDEQKKYLGMAAFLDERQWDWQHLKGEAGAPWAAFIPPVPTVNEYAYVPLGFYGYVAGPAGHKYYPNPAIFRYGSPANMRIIPDSELMRPGMDPIANAARYRTVRSWYAQ